MLSIGFIGFGNMAKAIYRSIKAHNPNQIIYLFDIDAEQYNDFQNTNICINVNQLCEKADVILLCVKPAVLSEVCKEVSIKDKAFVSIAAGITQDTLISMLPKYSRVARIMPNTPIMENKGMVCIQTPNNLSDDEENFIFSLFSRLGEVIKINGDKMDAVTGISGSGPAYVYLFINAMIKAAENNGISNENSVQMVLQTFEGACEMLRKTGKTPERLIKEVCSPNGTTLAAMNVLNKHKVSDSIEHAVNAAIKRSEEISQSI